MLPVIPVVLAGAAAAAGFVTGQRRWKARGHRLREQLDAARVQILPARVDRAEIDLLPRPARDWLANAILPDAPMTATVEMEHAGEFDSAASGRPRWGAFTSRQKVILKRPGFLWDARIALPGGLRVAVHDAYVAGDGVLEAALAGAVTLVQQRDSDELARGELLRFLAETPWYPTALLPSQGVRWLDGSGRTALATLADGNVRATLQFRFGADGMVESVLAEARGRTVGKTTVATPWEGRWSGWETRGPFVVPTEGEVAWLLPEGRRPYWRGRLCTITHQPA
ncbi:MAG: DUF6920 family protein [Thermaurantiacus sp.]